MNSNQLLSITINVLRFPLIVAVVFVHFYCDTVTYHGVEILMHIWQQLLMEKYCYLCWIYLPVSFQPLLCRLFILLVVICYFLSQMFIPLNFTRER